MKRKYLLLSFILVSLFTLMNTTKVTSNKTFAPPGYCGDPTTGSTCVTSGCHGGTNQGAGSQNLLITLGIDSTNMTDTLNANFKYVPGQTYYVSFDITAAGYAFGFETTALAPDSSFAGTFKVTSPHTRSEVGYMTHLIATAGYNKWLFQWTAPASNVGPVTFYYAFNAADSSDFGNYLNAVPSSNIFVGSTTITELNGVGINDIAKQISALQVYPNPVNGAFNLSFDVLTAANVNAAIYSIDGKLCKQLFSENANTGIFNRSFDVSSLASGIYFVKLNLNGASVTKKIVIQ